MLDPHSVTFKATLKLSSEAWELKKGHENRLEVAQSEFLIRLSGIIKLDRERNQYVKKKKTGVCRKLFGR
jgi:predicted acyl esterase